VLVEVGKVLALCLEAVVQFCPQLLKPDALMRPKYA
jgi:hypothetical protein